MAATAADVVSVRAAAFVFVVVLAGWLYLHVESAGKMSASSLEKLLYEDSLRWAPAHPTRVTCQRDPGHRWDYVCTDSYLDEVWGYDVNGAQVTRSAMLMHNGVTVTP